MERFVSLLLLILTSFVAKADYQVDPVVGRCLQVAKLYAVDSNQNFGSSPLVIRKYSDYCTVRTIRTCENSMGYEFNYNVNMKNWSVDSTESDSCEQRPD